MNYTRGIVFCSSDRERPRICKFLRSLNRTICSNSERSEQFLKQNAFLSLTILRSDQLEFKLEKIIGMQKRAGKVRRLDFLMGRNLIQEEAGISFLCANFEAFCKFLEILYLSLALSKQCTTFHFLRFFIVIILA